MTGIRLFLLFLATMTLSSAGSHAVLPKVTNKNSFLRLPDSEHQCPQIENVYFNEADTFIRSVGLPVALLSTTFQIKTPTGYCTASLISDDGLVLTAGHCLKKCIPDSNLPAGSPYDNGVKSSDGKTCELEINGNKVTVPIVSAHHCGTTASKAEEVEGRCQDTLDYAIVKLPPENTANFRCLELASTLPRINSGILAIGYPKSTARGGDNSKPGNSKGHGRQYISAGQYVDQDLCNLQTGDRGRIYSLKETKEKFPRYIQLSADIISGNSGGPVVSDSWTTNGKIIAVTVMTANPAPVDFDCPGSTFALPITTILEDTAKNNGAPLAPICKSKSALHSKPL